MMRLDSRKREVPFGSKVAVFFDILYSFKRVEKMEESPWKGESDTCRKSKGFEQHL